MGLKQWLEKPVAEAWAQSPRLNAVRGALARVTTPLLPDDYLHLVNPLWSARELRGRVVHVQQETANSATLTIQPGWGFDFQYQPGQYIGIGVLVDGRWHWRSYSLTSTPTAGSGRRNGLISITVKAMPEGFLSSHIVGGVPAGTIVRLAAPQGDFTLPEPPPASVLFVTAGSGITPVIAMLRMLRERRELGDVMLVHSAPTPDDVLFHAELEDLQREFPDFRAYLRFTRTGGKFAPAALDEVVPDWRTRDCWACGPVGMLTELEEFYAAAGLSERLHIERFELARADADARGGVVTFARSGKQIEVDGATSLLQAGEQAGVLMPFGCRMGICQTCVVPLTGGHVRDLRSGADHGEGQRIQTCVSVAAGDCTLDA